MNLIFSILILSLNLSIVLYFKKIISIKKEAIIGVAIILSLIILNLIFQAIPKQILSLLVMFSFSLIILRFMSKSSKVYDNSKALNPLQKAKIKEFKSILFDYVFPILISIYQLLSIWNKGLQEQIINN